MSVSCLFPGCFSLSPGSNLPNPTSWRVVPWLCLWDAVLKHIQVLNLGIFRAQDINFPAQGTRGLMSMSNLFPLPKAEHTGFGICTSSVGIWEPDQDLLCCFIHVPPEQNPHKTLAHQVLPRTAGRREGSQEGGEHRTNSS